MILLLGGTGETAEIATKLADAGYAVLVSTATDAELDVGSHPGITRRAGRLSQEDMLLLVRDRGIRAIVDATHPYATVVSAAAAEAAKEACVPYLAFVRPATELTGEDVVVADNHESAAVLAFAERRPVLLTTGSRNLEPHVRESRRTGTKLIARVLDHPESIDACRSAGLRDDEFIVGRGPFSIDENREVIRAHGIGVLVTKDSGRAGGVYEKLESARAERCKVVIVGRPQPATQDAFECVQALITEVIRRIPPSGV